MVLYWNMSRSAAAKEKLRVVVNEITIIKKKKLLNHDWPNAWSNSSALLQSNKT